MIKTRHIVKGTAATLLAVFGLIVAAFGLKNMLLPSARHRRSLSD